jgi:uncharacterized protein YeaO (DUF488 family)
VIAAIKTQRWNDPVERGDGRRVLICRYRPRAFGWAEYRKRYLDEMKEQQERIRALAARLGAGQTITLLCWSACTDPERCHRTSLKGLIEKGLAS